MSTDEKKYVPMEAYIAKINGMYVSLNDEDIKRNNSILRAVIDIITSKIKENNILFTTMFQNIFFGGSYYDNLKVGNPEEYDLDIILRLPKIIKPNVVTSDLPGYVHLLLDDYKILKTRDEVWKYKGLEDLLTEDQKTVSCKKVLAWMESLVIQCLNSFPKDTDDPSHCVMEIKYCDNEEQKIQMRARCTKSGPALTLKLKGQLDNKDIIMDIDLVPSFQFTDKNWPETYRKIPPNIKKNTFCLVPKMPKSSDVLYDTYWRLSFQEQERELITGGELRALKPTLKIMKKLRDFQNHKAIASYFLKTIFLWKVMEEDIVFWKQPASVLLMKMLSVYADHLSAHNIPYFWNDKLNLIGHLKEATCFGWANTIKRIMKDIDKNLDTDPCRIATYLLPPTEVELLRKEVPIPLKKTLSLNFNNLLNTASSSSSSSVSQDDVIQSLINVNNNSKQKNNSESTQLSQILKQLEKITTQQFQITSDYKRLSQKLNNGANSEGQSATEDVTQLFETMGRLFHEQTQIMEIQKKIDAKVDLVFDEIKNIKEDIKLLKNNVPIEVPSE